MHLKALLRSLYNLNRSDTPAVDKDGQQVADHSSSDTSTPSPSYRNSFLASTFSLPTTITLNAFSAPPSPKQVLKATKSRLGSLPPLISAASFMKRNRIENEDYEKMSTPPLSCCSPYVAEDPFARVCPSPVQSRRDPNGGTPSNLSSRSHSPTISMSTTVSTSPSVCDFFPPSPTSTASISVSPTTASTAHSFSSSVSSPSSFLSNASYTSQNTIITSTELSTSPPSPRKGNSLKHTFSRQRSVLNLRHARPRTAPLQSNMPTTSAYATVPTTPTLPSKAEDGRFAVSHASTPVPHKRSSRFIEHFDTVEPFLSSFDNQVNLDLFPFPPPRKAHSTFPASSSSRYPNSRSRSRLEMSKAPQQDEEVVEPAVSDDYPFFGANGNKVKEGRPVMLRKGMSLPALSTDVSGVQQSYPMEEGTVWIGRM